MITRKTVLLLPTRRFPPFKSSPGLDNVTTKINVEVLTSSMGLFDGARETAVCLSYNPGTGTRPQASATLVTHTTPVPIPVKRATRTILRYVIFSLLYKYSNVDESLSSTSVPVTGPWTGCE